MIFIGAEKIARIKKWMSFCVSASCFFGILNGCESVNNYSTNLNHRLTFSGDTLSFDTIFSTIGSTTKQFMVYNPNGETLRIETILLANPGKTGFRINVDGRKGDTFKDIDLWKKDSLYVSVEVTVDPGNGHQPFVVEDSVLFYVNGIRQSVLLQAYGQNVHLLKGGATIRHDSTFRADLPYLIYDSLKVAENVTLTLEKGVIMYMHDKAKLMVDGAIKAKGTQEEPVIIRGDRLDHVIVTLPYDRTPGQWDGIYFGPSSFDNEFDYVFVRNGVTGLTFYESQPDKLKINIRNSQITNMDNNLLVAINCHIEASNSEFTNATDSTVTLVGGIHQFTHCTIANYKTVGARNGMSPCLTLSNQWTVGDLHTPYPLKQAYFDNCIIDGNHSADSAHLFSGEIGFDTPEKNESEGNDATFNYRFNTCFIKTARLNNARFIDCLFIKSPSYLMRGKKEDNYAFDFRLANESAGIGKANHAIAEQYPVDRYGVNRLTGDNAPSIGAYEYVYQEEEKEEKR